MDKYACRPVLGILLIVVILGLVAFQPAFFGDELFPYFIARTSGDLPEIYFRINQYKPRLLFNGLWAVGVWAELPRFAVGMFNIFAMAWAGVASFAISRMLLRASVATSFAVALCVVMSRFGIIFYYDYLSGTIGTLGLALFLTTALVLVREIERPYFRRGVAAAAVTLSVATILTYETYIAALFALGVGTSIVAFLRRSDSDRQWTTAAATGVAVWVLPLVCFVVATHWMSSLSVMTGTAGESVTFSIATAGAFAQFTSNVFLGTNFGHEWFVGTLHSEGVLGRFSGYVFAATQATLWGLALMSAAGRWSPRHLTGFLWLLSIALATIAISSLPGLDRADARWMFPLSALVALLVVSIPPSIAQKGLLLSILGVSCFHLAFSNAEGIYNVRASKISGEISDVLRNVVPVAQRGIVSGVPDNELEWILGGNALQGNDVRSGETYCWINLDDAPCIDPRSALYTRSTDDYGFLLIHAASGGPPFLVQGPILQTLLRPLAESFSQARTIGGDGIGWGAWRWVEGELPAEQDAPISGNTHATLTLPVSDLKGAVLGYLVSSSAHDSTTMRLQVNWLRSDRSFIAPQIQLAKPVSSREAFTMLLLPPHDAAFGEVYITLHEAGPGLVTFHHVALFDR